MARHLSINLAADPYGFAAVQASDPKRARELSRLADRLMAEYRRNRLRAFIENCAPRPVEDEDGADLRIEDARP